ncbi:FMN-linked oxidoreductase [Lentinula edodes]|uniref:FMN-linked oxidoreductase n=1 Tax=Lentinula edodes TaxID=5353 RepID=UPI001E8D7875|nr:FMN-linked oxidoreductase [Lentinula edodes]KAH7871254.1 FMN-linked oxidoreductase [Lentinula edodes]
MAPTTTHYINKAAPGAPFFTPLQSPASGTALDPQPNGKPIPKLFTPLKIRDVTFQNRIFLAPLCQYSASNGFVTPWHMAHLGGIISRGPGLSIVEATAVLPEGRITPEDNGIWDDAHIKGFREIVDFAHSQNQKIAIQLAHAGRKASTVAPFLHLNANATLVAGGWQPLGPSAIPFSEVNQTPNQLTKEEIQHIIKAWADAAKRAVAAGFDVIEIHNAHGYLLMSFISPVTNHRTDEYGGSFENRIRLTLEIIDAIRAVIPDGMPLFLRVSASDRIEHLDEPSWTNQDTIKFASIIAEHGVDFIDVSSAGNHSKQDFSNPRAQQEYAAEISQSLKDNGKHGQIFVGTVGGITSGVQAEKYLQDGVADVCLVGRHFQKNPGLVWAFAEELGIRISLANQISWGFYGRGSGNTTKKT